MKQKIIDNTQNNLPLYLFHQGTNYTAYEYLGSHFGKKDGKEGVYFRTFAPKASAVSVVGDFNNWDIDSNPMTRISDGGVFECFVEGLKEYDCYKYAITNKTTKLKSDPYAFHSETTPANASKVYNLDGFFWSDADFIKNKTSVYDKPVNIYEVNLLSWKKHKDGSYFTYKEYADELVSYVYEMGYTHIELMPISEFPFDGSWGYQVTGYYSITSRFGTPKDFMYFVDCCHKKGISVILDWVPAHFPKDEHGLFEFDGDYCYESNIFGRVEHKTWGTRMFDWGRNEVKSFLISNANFLFDKFHIDGLRIDAVSSMLYLDYDRKDGEWIANIEGGNYNLEAIQFFRDLNTFVFSKYPNAIMAAEESTAFPMITKPAFMGGLGFNFKWNMGWMNDSLSFMQIDPYFRPGSHNKLTFSMCYAFSENYVLPISHDEVVHGKKSLVDKMPGDIESKFSNLRAFYGYMFSHPGKKLNFMGNEFAQFREWTEKEGLEFFMLDFPLHSAYKKYVKTVNHIYKNTPALYEIDNSWQGFSWICVDDYKNSVISYVRQDKNGKKVYVLVNFSGIDHKKYRIGAEQGEYKIILCSDDKKFGGKGLLTKKTIKSAKKKSHGMENSLCLHLPALSVLYLIKK